MVTEELSPCEAPETIILRDSSPKNEHFASLQSFKPVLVFVLLLFSFHLHLFCFFLM